MKLNREHAAALRAALPLLWNGRGRPRCGDWGSTEYICHTLELAGAPGAPDVQAEILRRLGRRSALGSWLIAEHGITGTDLQMQAHRKAWMLLMIQEGES